MGDFSTGFGTGFQIGTIIKEKQKAKKALEQVKATLEEWKLSGKEPSYVDKILMSTMLNNVGQSYAASFQSIDNNKANMDQEKLAQDAMTLRSMNENVLNFVKQTSAMIEDGTIDMIDWTQFKDMFSFDITKMLNRETIDKLKDENTRKEALEEITGVAGKLPEEYRKSYFEQAGVIPEGLQPTTTPKAPGISDYKGAVDYLKNFSKITTPPDTFNKVKAGLQNKFPDIDLSDITQESLREPEKAVADTKPKIQDPNDVLFGTNGIMKNYINSGSQLGDEQKTEIRNNYNLIKPSLSADVRTQVEDYLKQIGIDVNASVEEQKNYTIMTDDELSALPDDPLAVEELKRRKAQFGGGLTKWWNKITKPGGTPAYKGTPQQKDYTAMSNDELADLALFGDTSAIEELKRRGLI